MRALLLLLLLLPLGTFQAHAQQAAKGPWQVTYQRVRARPEDFDGDGWGSRDTTTTWQTRRILQKAPWNVSPDSIRLFLNCDNPLLAPAARSGIRFTATGATLRLDAKQGLLWVYAAAPRVVLRAFRGKVQVFSHEFQAISPPLPTAKVFLGGRPTLDCKRPGPLTQVRAMSVKVIPNRFFAEFMPDEARYRASKYNVTLLRGEKVIAGPVAAGPGSVAPSDSTVRESEKLAQPGDRVKIEVQEAERQNSRGQVEQVPLHKQFLLPY